MQNLADADVSMHTLDKHSVVKKMFQCYNAALPWEEDTEEFSGPDLVCQPAKKLAMDEFIVVLKRHPEPAIRKSALTIIEQAVGFNKFQASASYNNLHLFIDQNSLTAVGTSTAVV